MYIQKRGTLTRIEDRITPSVANTNRTYQFDTKNAPDLLVRAIVDGQPITIVGDYDCDGIAASAISFRGFNRLKELLTKARTEASFRSLPAATQTHLLNLIQKTYQCDTQQAQEILHNNHADQARVRVRIPRRYTEGYGMKAEMVDEVKSGVLFTVDNGIAAADAIQKAKDKGLTTIVTDHHALPITKKLLLINTELVEVNEYRIPNADCVINPHMEQTMEESGHYDFYDYCGAGVALKIVEELLGQDTRTLDELYAFAALATVADVMPMIEDNRNIFNRGVKAMVNGRVTPGLSALLEVSKIDPRHLPDNHPAHMLITSDTIGFTLGPKINAPGRVGTSHPDSAGGDRGAERSLRCLLASDWRQARELANELHVANENRKEIAKQMQMKAEMVISRNGMQNDCPLVVHIPECGDGIIGLVAGYLCETYCVPAIVINGHGEHCKGSARSPEGANIKALLDECQHLLVAYGGHPGAAGLTISEESIDKFRNMLYNTCKKQGITSQKVDAVQYDLEIDAKDLQHNLDVAINKLAPFGECNPEPVFLVRNFQAKDVVVLGDKHLKLIGDNASAIGFFMAEDASIMEHIETNKTYDLLGTLSYNCFRGKATPQLSIQEIVNGNEIIRDEPDEPDLDEDILI